MKNEALVLVSYGTEGFVELPDGSQTACRYRRSIGRPFCGDRVIVENAGEATAAETLESVIKKVDSKIYYPRMRSLQADAESSRLKQQLENVPNAESIKLTFYWTRPDKQRFVVSGASDESDASETPKD